MEIKLLLIMHKGHTKLLSIYAGYSLKAIDYSWSELLPGRKTVGFCFDDEKFKAIFALNGDTGAFEVTVPWWQNTLVFCDSDRIWWQ